MSEELSWQWKAFLALGKKYEVIKAALQTVSECGALCNSCQEIAEDALKQTEVSPNDSAVKDSE